MARPLVVNKMHRSNNTLARAREEACQPRGLESCIGFIPHLKHPTLDLHMPILIETPVRRADRRPVPRITGDVSMWALPGGGIYIHRKPVQVCVR